MGGNTEKALDGSVGGALDPGGVKKDTASNEEKAPTKEEQLRGQDVSELEAAALVAVNQIKQLDVEASALNAKKEEIRQRMESKGINRHALAASVRISKMDEDKLDGYDLSLLILRRAIGNPMQPDLFAVK